MSNNLTLSGLCCYTEKKHGEQDHTANDPDVCKSVLEGHVRNTVDGQSQQEGPLGENQLSSNSDRNS